MIIVAVAVAVIAVIGISAYFLMRRNYTC